MKKNLRQKQLRVFTIGLVLLLLYFAWRQNQHDVHSFGVWASVMLAIMVILVSKFYRSVFEKFFDGWMKVVGMIGFCVNTIFLTAIYYGLFTPVSVVLRLRRKDFMNRSIDSQSSSYWISCEHPIKNRESYEKQY